MFNSKIKIAIVAIILLIGIGFSTFWFTRPKNSKSETVSNSEKISIVTSFYPLYEFSKNVGGDKVNAVNLTPGGVDAHDFEPKSQDTLLINKSNLFVFLGAGFDPWAEKASSDLKDKSLEISKSFELMKAEDSEEEEKGKTEKEENELDPHIWLDPINSIKIVELISDKLIKVDNKNSQFYKTNAENYIKDLQKLDSDFKTAFKSCKKDTFVVSHNAFSYFAKRYNLKVKSIAGLEPSDEPTTNEIAQIVELIKNEKLTTVYFENQLNSDLAKTIASEAKANPVVIYSLESLTPEQLSSGKNYIDLMQENLKNLKQGLECS